MPLCESVLRVELRISQIDPKLINIWCSTTKKWSVTKTIICCNNGMKLLGDLCEKMSNKIKKKNCKGLKNMCINIDELAKPKSPNKAWINATNSKGETPLHIAAKNQKYKLFQTMLPYLKNINITDNQGNTILHSLLDINAHANHDKLISLLGVVTSRGADPNRTNKSGVTAAHLAATHCNTRLLNALKAARADFYLRTSDGETPLFLVCKSMLYSKDTVAGMKAVDYLMNIGCDLNAKDDKGHTILHYSVSKSWSDKIVKGLIKRGADVNCQTRNHKLTPLHLACQRRCKSKLEILVRAGANVNAVSADGQTPVHSAVSSDSLKLIRSLIKYGADVNYAEDFAPLHMAVSENCKDAFKFLISKGANVNVESKHGLTPLHLASALGGFWFVKALIDRKANVNCRDKNGYTPLHFAIRSYGKKEYDGYLCFKEYFISTLVTQPQFISDLSNRDIVNLLINAGSDVNAVTKYGVSALHRAAETGDTILVTMLLNHKASVNCVETNFGFPPLHVALVNRHQDVAETLMIAKSNVNLLAKNGKSPLHIASKVDSGRLVEELIRHGALVNRKAAGSGFTPLHIACHSNVEYAVIALINAGADVNALSRDGKSPLHQAVESSDVEIIRLLLDRGAKLSCPGKRCWYTLLSFISRDGGIANIRMDNTSETWLHSTVSLISERKTVELFLGLCALVNSHNKNSCMPVHRLLRDNRVQHFEFGKSFGMDVSECDVYDKSFFRCSMNDVGDNIHKLEFMYLYKILVFGLPMAKIYQNYLNYSMFSFFPNLECAYHPEFLNEVQKLKDYIVKDNVSLYKLLYMNHKDRCSYSKSLNLREIEVQFPIYYELIAGCYNDAIVRGPLVKTAQFALRQLVNIEFPVLCVDKICSTLSVIDLIALIQAVEIDDANDK